MDIVTNNKKIMKRFQWLFLFLCVTSGNVAACYPGIQTNGGTSPYGDINILVGDDLVINCTLNIDYVGPSSANDIIWRFNGQQQLTTSKYVTVLDNRTSQLVLPKMSRSDDGTYTCQLKRRPPETKDQAICSNRVRVAEPLPKQLSQFDCISIELKNMTCTWPAPSYGLPTDWSLTYKHFMGYAECSQYLKSETSKDNYGCLFSVSSNPPYDTSKLDFTFNLTGKNNISETSTSFRVPHYSRVIAAPPAYLSISSIGINNINVSWAINSEFSKYQLPMVYRLTYTSEWNPGNSTSIEVVNVTNYVLTGLSPWTVYTVTIRCRVQLAPDEDKMWSSSLTVTNRTHGSKPTATVVMSPSGYEDVNVDMDKRNITVFWKPLQPSEYNGPSFVYTIRVFSGDIEVRHSTKYGQNFSASFTHMEQRKSYRITIESANDFGTYSNKAEIHVPDVDSNSPDVDSITVIYYEDQLYEISWNNSNDSKLKDCTIFWCKSHHIREDSCLEPPNWISGVDCNLNIYNLTVAERDTNYRFAIATNDRNTSSGMVWSKCAASHDGDVGKVMITSLMTEGPTKIRVTWNMDCRERKGNIKGFLIMYCEHDELDYRKSCKGEQKNKTVDGLQSITAVLENLKPYTNYSVRVAAMTRSSKLGEPGDAMLVQTSEGTPEGPPTDIRTVEVTNHSISLRWNRPKVTNGKVVTYSIQFIDQLTKKKATLYPKPVIEQAFINKTIESYRNYSIEIQACIKSNCSKSSDPIYVTTMIGYPGKPERPIANRKEGNNVEVQWGMPHHPNGPINEWELEVNSYPTGQPNDTDQATKHNLSTTSKIISYECEKKTTFIFVVRAVNYDESGARLIGHESDATPFDACNEDPRLSNLILVFIILGTIVGIAIPIYPCRILYLRVKNEIKKIKEIKVDLPAGLADQSNRNDLKNGFEEKPKSLDLHGTPLYSRLQSVSSEEGRTSQSSQSSTETTVENTLSISSEPEDILSCDTDIYGHRSLASPINSDSGNETDIAHSPDSVFEESTWSSSGVQDQNKDGEKPQAANTGYSRLALMLSPQYPMENQTPSTVIIQPSVVTVPLDPVPPYSRVGMVPSTLNYIRLADVSEPSTVQADVSNDPSKVTNNKIQAGYSKVAQLANDTEPAAVVVEPAAVVRPAPGYVMVQSSPIDGGTIIDDGSSGSEPEISRSYLGFNQFESMNPGQGQGYISIDSQTSVQVIR